MATRTKGALSDLIQGHRILVDNCLDDLGIGQTLARYGYDVEALKTGREMLQRLERAQATQDAEYGDQLAATEAVEKAWKKTREFYSDALALARIAFKNNLDAQRALRLNGVRRESLSGWLEDAKVFYQQLLENPAWVQALERYDYSVERLTQEGGRGPGQTVGRGQRMVQRSEGSGEGGGSERPAPLVSLNLVERPSSSPGTKKLRHPRSLDRAAGSIRGHYLVRSRSRICSHNMNIPADYPRRFLFQDDGPGYCLPSAGAVEYCS